MYDIIQKFLADHAQVILALFIINVALSAISAAAKKVLASPYADKIPGLAKIVSVIDKVLEILSANLPHSKAEAAAIEAKLDQPKV